MHPGIVGQDLERLVRGGRERVMEGFSEGVVELRWVCSGYYKKIERSVGCGLDGRGCGHMCLRGDVISCAAPPFPFSLLPPPSPLPPPLLPLPLPLLSPPPPIS